MISQIHKTLNSISLSNKLLMRNPFHFHEFNIYKFFLTRLYKRYNFEKKKTILI